MRLFTAIDIPEAVRETLRALIDRLRPTAKLSWSPVENLHVTTKFVGEWPEPRLNELKRALAEIPKTGPVDIAVRGVGWFPNPRNPRVFWAGIEGSPSLGELARRTDETTARLGVATEEREFHPHLTLARRREPVPLETLKQRLAELGPVEFGSFRATSFFLYLSKGGKYTQLQEFPFA
jgi:2'-5' RNA ligase